VIAVWVGLVVAGAVGAPCRYLVDTVVGDRTGGDVPWGTFLINVSGSFVLGLITGAALYHAFPDTPKIILGTGFCGAYTTFSTWSFETVRLLEKGALRQAALNVGASLVAGLAAAGIGLALAAVV
jgi:CrcB protein